MVDTKIKIVFKMMVFLSSILVCQLFMLVCCRVLLDENYSLEDIFFMTWRERNIFTFVAHIQQSVDKGRVISKCAQYSRCERSERLAEHFLVHLLRVRQSSFLRQLANISPSLDAKVDD